MDYDITLSNFRFNLKLLRMDHEISADELSKQLDFSKKRIADIEGRVPPTLVEIVAVANYFDVTPDNLLIQRGGVTFELNH